MINIKIKHLDTGITLITLVYKGKSYTTGAFFVDEIGGKVQLLLEAALKEHNQL